MSRRVTWLMGIMTNLSVLYPDTIGYGGSKLGECAEDLEGRARIKFFRHPCRRCRALNIHVLVVLLHVTSIANG